MFNPFFPSSIRHGTETLSDLSWKRCLSGKRSRLLIKLRSMWSSSGVLDCWSTYLFGCHSNTTNGLIEIVAHLKTRKHLIMLPPTAEYANCNHVIPFISLVVSWNHSMVFTFFLFCYLFIEIHISCVPPQLCTSFSLQEG